MTAPPSLVGREVRACLRRHHGIFPRTQRILLVTGLGLVAAYVALQLFLQWTDPVLGSDLLRLFFLTLVAGREPALFAVYHSDHPVPVAWAAAMSTVDDLATLLLAVPLVWLLLDRLRRAPVFDGALRSLEHSLREHRRFIDRAGVLGLALFLWLPGWGTGPSMAGGLGVAAGIAAGRLVAWLSLSILGVNLFWALALAQTARVTPDQGWWQYLPLGIVAVLVLLATVSAVRRRHRRFLLEYPVPPSIGIGVPPSLAARGFARRDHVLVLDTRRLEALGGPRHTRVAQCHWAGAFLFLPSIPPRVAAGLAGLGLTGPLDLLVLPEDLLHRVAAVLGVAEAVPAWQAEAQQWAASNASTFSP